MQNILEYCWQHYLINCVVQIQNANGRVLHYTYYPFTAEYCGHVKPVLVNEFNGIALENEELFPKKLKNLYGCPLRAALWDVPPYVSLSTDANNVLHITGGFEGKLLLELAKKLNFTLDIIVPPNNSKRGVVLSNGTLTGALKLSIDSHKSVKMFPMYPNTLMFYTILMLSTKPITGGPEWQQHEYEITRNISEALAEIINTLFIDDYHLSVINFQVKVKGENLRYLHEFHTIMDETIQLLSDNIALRLKNGIAIPPDNERHYCILLVDSKESLEFLYADIYKYHLFVDGSYFIVLQTFPHVHRYYDELFDIFQLNRNNGIIHADVLVSAVYNVIILFQNIPFSPFHCQGVAPVISNKFINGHWQHKTFYTPKSKNLYGCPLVCATWEDLPYLQVLDGAEGSKVKYYGLEGDLLQYLANQINFTIIIRWMSKEEVNQTLYDERGVFNKLFENGTDLVIGAFHYKPTSLEDSYAPTAVYYMSNYYFLISSQTEAYDPFTKLLLPFHTELWIVLIVTFSLGNIIVFIVLYLNRKFKSLILGRENQAPAYNMVVISLGGAVTKDPKVPFSRFLLMLWLLATFILRTVYQAFMFHFIKSDLQKPLPKFMHDLWQNQYHILMTDEVHKTIAGLPILYATSEVLNVSEFESFEILKNSRDKLAILMAYEYYGYYKLTMPINNYFYVVPEKLFTQQLSIYMRKNSQYLKRFNIHIDRYINEGLMNRWERYLMYETKAVRLTDDGPKAMKISHLFGAVRLLLMGLLGSFLVFLGEIFVYLAKRLKKRLKRK